MISSDDIWVRYSALYLQRIVLKTNKLKKCDKELDEDNIFLKRILKKLYP